MQPGHSLPLIGTWLYHRQVQALARSVTAGNMAAISTLAAIIASTDNPRARLCAENCLRSLPTMHQIDLLCREVLVQDSTAITTLVQECGYLPSDQAERALFLFCTRSREVPEIPDEEYLELNLARGYLKADPGIRTRARDNARRNNTCHILARAICSSGMPGPVELSYAEWEIVIAGLIQVNSWEILWHQVLFAPIPLAVTAVTAMKGAGWTPTGDDQRVWEGITETLPAAWTYPSPSVGTYPAIGRPAAQVSRLAFSPDGSLLATGCCDGQIQIWRTVSSGLAGEISSPRPGHVHFLSLSGDNRYLISCWDGGCIQCHDLPGSTLIWSHETGPGEITAVCRAADDRTFLAGDSLGTLHILDGDGRILRAVKLHPSPVTCLVLSPDGTAAACGHNDGTVSLVGFVDETLRYLPPGSPDPVRSIAFDPAGIKCLVVHDRTLPVLWDVGTATRIRIYTGHMGIAACSTIPAEKGWFVIGSSDHTLRTWDWQCAKPAASLPLYSRLATCCSAARDGRYLTVGFNDGTIRLFSMPGLGLVWEYKGHKKAITACAISSDGSRLATVSWDGTTKLWRIPEGEIIRTLENYAVGIAALAGPGGGSLFAAVTGGGIACIHTVADGRQVRTIDLYTPEVRATAMSPNGKHLACAGADTTLRVWNLHDGSLVSTGRKFRTSQRCCTFLPGGSSLFCGGWDGRCRIFSIPEVRLEKILAGHTSVVTCCAVTGDGQLIVTGSNDTTVRIWQRKEGEEEKTCVVLTGSRTEIGAIVVSPDNTLLAAGGGDEVIRLYRLPGGEPAGELPGIPGKVTALAFDPAGDLLAAGYDTGISAWYAVPGRTLIRTEPAHTGAVTGIAVFPKERLLVTSGQDGTCRFHPLPVASFLPGAKLADVSWILAEAGRARGNPDERQWTFLYSLLASRFRHEIQICPSTGNIGCYDIQIAG